MSQTLHGVTPIVRKTTRQIAVRDVLVGGGAPVTVQSMTNTDTRDHVATLGQVEALAAAGADIVRVSVPDEASAEGFARLRKETNVPLVADIHFDYKMGVLAADAGADCLRINPGNIGRIERVKELVSAAEANKISMRLGVNAGSLERDIQQRYGEPTPQALVESAMRQVAVLESLNFDRFKVSIKASDVRMCVDAYDLLAKEIDYPIHLGITEAGSFRPGTVKSALGIGQLLLRGIGDTLRVSLAADPVEEVKVGWDILKSLHLRKRGVNLVACPSCARQNFDVISTVNALEERLADVQEDIDVAVIGCYVNGPGESKIAEVGVTGSRPSSMIYIDGKTSHKVTPEKLVDEVEQIVRQRIAQRARTIATETGS